MGRLLSISYSQGDALGYEIIGLSARLCISECRRGRRPEGDLRSLMSFANKAKSKKNLKLKSG